MPSTASDLVGQARNRLKAPRDRCVAHTLQVDGVRQLRLATDHGAHLTEHFAGQDWPPRRPHRQQRSKRAVSENQDAGNGVVEVSFGADRRHERATADAMADRRGCVEPAPDEQIVVMGCSPQSRAAVTGRVGNRRRPHAIYELDDQRAARGRRCRFRNDRQVEGVGQPGSHHVDAEAWFYAQFAVLEAQLADEAPGPPVAVRTSPQGRIILVIDAAGSRETQHVIVILEVIGEAAEPLLLAGVRGCSRGQGLKDDRGAAHSTFPAISTARSRLSSLVAVSASRPPRYWASSGSNENTQRSSIDGRGRPLAIHSTPPLSCLRPRSHRPAKKAASKKYV